MIDRNFFVRLAFATHRVADALPQTESVAGAIREAANEVLAGFFKQDAPEQIERQVGVLLELLEKARKGAWINPINFSVLDAEWRKAQGSLGGSTEQTESDLTERQKKIVEFLRAKPQAQVWEFQRILPQVTKRTLRRDLDDLLQKNLVERRGEWNTVAYELK